MTFAEIAGQSTAVQFRKLTEFAFDLAELRTLLTSFRFEKRFHSGENFRRLDLSQLFDVSH